MVYVVVLCITSKQQKRQPPGLLGYFCNVRFVLLITPHTHVHHCHHRASCVLGAASYLQQLLCVCMCHSALTVTDRDLSQSPSSVRTRCWSEDVMPIIREDDVYISSASIHMLLFKLMSHYFCQKKGAGKLSTQMIKLFCRSNVGLCHL